MDYKIVYYVQTNIVCMVLLGLIFYICQYQKVAQKDTMRYISSMIVVMFIYCISDIIAILFADHAGSCARVFNYIANSIYYLSTVVLSALWLVYTLKETCSYIGWKKYIRLFASICVGIFIVLLIANPFTKWMFYIDEFGVYHRGDLVFMHPLLSVIMLGTAEILVLVSYRKKRVVFNKTYLSYLFYFPIVGIGFSAIQMAMHGLTISQVGITFGLLLVFVHILYDNARLDALTGLQNRHSLIHYKKRLLKKHRGEVVMALMIDINEFKKVNDQYGHAVGDEMIVGIAEAILKVCHKVHRKLFVCRYGGDEFLILGVGGVEQAHAEIFKEDMANVVQHFVEKYEIAFGLNLGFGLAEQVLECESDLDKIIDHADEKMYVDKRKKKQDHKIKLKLAQVEDMAQFDE